MIAVDLLAYAQTLLLHDTPLARVEPKTLRYRLLHVAGRLTRGGRRLRLRTHLLDCRQRRMPRLPRRSRMGWSCLTLSTRSCWPTPSGTSTGTGGRWAHPRLCWPSCGR